MSDLPLLGSPVEAGSVTLRNRIAMVPMATGKATPEGDVTPELAEHYSMVMRYKAAAKKLRQVVGLADPTPVAAVLAGAHKDAENSMGDGVSCDHGAEKSCGAGTPPVEVVRARAVYMEAMEGVPDVAARVMARIDALCDPERLDEAATLRGWREKYVREITVRRKESWWRRLTA